MKKLLTFLTLGLLWASTALAQTTGPTVLQSRPPGSGGPTIDDVATYTTNYIPYSTGITSLNTARTRAIYSSHTRNLNVAVFNDSTGMGVNETAVPYNTQYPNAYPRQLATALTTLGIPASSQNVWGISGATLVDYLNRNSWTTTSGAASLGTTAVQGGIGWNLTAVGGTLNFVLPGPIDTCQLYYSDGNNTRSIDYTIDGGSVVTINFSTTSQIARTAPIAMGSAAGHTFSAAFGAASSGGVTVYGIDCWNSANIGVDIWQFSGSGFASANLLTNSGIPSAGRLQQLQNFPPDLAFLGMGVNDWRQSVTVATFKSNMTTFVQFLKGIGTNVIITTPLFDNGTTGLTADQASYVQALYDISVSEGVGIIDMRRKWGSYGLSVANGFQYNPGFTAALTVTNATYSGVTGRATYTVASTTTMTTGNITAVTGITSSGGSGNGYNGLGPITVLSGTTFSMQLGVAPGTYTSGGSALVADNVHPLYSGYTDYASVLAQAIQNIVRAKFQ